MNFLTAKEVGEKLGVSQRTAYQLIKDIKNEYQLKTNKITENHLNKYLNV